MKVDTNCPHCQKAYRFADRNVGKEAKCRACGQVFRIAAGPPPPMQQVVVVQQSQPTGSKLVALVIWFFFGAFGAHRCYTRDMGTAAALFVSFGFCLLTFGVWLPVHVVLVLLDGVLILLDKRLR